MGEIVYAHPHPLPEGDFYITCFPFLGRIRPDKIDEFFGATKHFEGSLAELLLDNNYTAVYHMDPNYTQVLGKKLFVQPVLLGVNYHRAQEGKNKIIVQDVQQRIGPWVLFRPPESDNKVFHLQDVSFPRLVSPMFEESEINPAKINKRFLYRGDPLVIFEDFKRLGFVFKDRADL